MLQTGKLLPAFALPDANGNLHNSKDWKGKPLVLFCYPKALTPACTAEACSLSASMDWFRANNIQVVGLSIDEPPALERFIARHNLNLLLLADAQHKAAEKLGVWGEKKLYGKTYMGLIRTTFLVDAGGRIAELVQKVNTKAHAQQVQELVRALGWC